MDTPESVHRFEVATQKYIACLSRLMFVQRQSNVPSSDLLDEICVRFILTLPATELESFERLLFSVEQAWWHYEVCSFQTWLTRCPL